MYELLKAHGHEITLDWTVEAADGKTGIDRQNYLALCAARDLNAVRRADVVIFIDVENTTMRGAYIEAGAALGLGKPVIVVGAKPGTLDLPGSCIFFALPEVHKVATDIEAVGIVDALAYAEYSVRGEFSY